MKPSTVVLDVAQPSSLRQANIEHIFVTIRIRTLQCMQSTLFIAGATAVLCRKLTQSFKLRVIEVLQ